MTIGRIPGATGIQPTIVDAKGDIIAATAADSVTRLVAGANETRLVADSAQAAGLKYVADTTNYAVAAKGDLLAGTAADTVAALTVGANGTTLVADSAEATGLKWAAASSGLTLINTTSFSAVASQLVDGVFSSTYDNYYITLNCTSSARTNMIFYLRVSSTDTTTAYERQSITGVSTTIGGNRASDSEFAVLNSTGLNSMDLTLFSPNIAQRTTALTRSLRDDSGIVLFNFSVQQTAATQFTGIKFLTGSGTMTGSLSIYGMSK